MNQEVIENLNRLITSTEIKTIIKKFPTNKSPRPDGFIGEFYQKFRAELTPILLNLFQKIVEECKFPNLFYEATITPIAKLDKDAAKKKKKEKKKKTIGQFTDEHRCKNTQQNSSKQNATTYVKDHTFGPNGLYPRDARILQYSLISQCDIPH